MPEGHDATIEVCNIMSFVLYTQILKQSVLKPASPGITLRWKFSRITYIEDRSFEGKNYTIFGGKIDKNSAKIGSECTLCIHFCKNYLGETPSPPYCEKVKKSPSLALYDLLQLRWKFSRITYIEDRSFESNNYTRFFGRKINTNSAKNGLRMHHLHPFFTKFPGGGPPDPHLREGGFPSRTLPPAALCADLVTPPDSGPSGSATDGATSPPSFIQIHARM